MPSLLIIVFILQLTIHSVNTFGVATINSLLWTLFNMLPVPTSKAAAEQNDLKSQFLELRKEMNATSSQDEFAKWAKLRRQHDKLLEQIEKTKSTLDSTKSTFDSVVNGLRWLGLNGVRMLLQFWFQKQPMFWLPKGWAPYYAEWLLSFPRAPVGSVSIQSWSIACMAIILLVSDALVSAVGLALAPKAPSKTAEPRKAPSEEKAARAEESRSQSEKKEL
ncbi:protein get1 [Amylocarpus encephaloides]|uniref:Protein get1 n=1 Tax=Amylocarpus encephaloides TaxID=45428 RepID=A0A9P7YK65_9HELO|nr:protein get1 [Amylocarpus encephaloides]